MPEAGPMEESAPPVFTTTCNSRRVLFSSEAKCTRERSWAPKNFAGQWHCSQVSRAGRKSLIGVGMGRENVLKVTARTWRKPLIFDLTYQLAPGPMWQEAQETRACGEP